MNETSKYTPITCPADCICREYAEREENDEINGTYLDALVMNCPHARAAHEELKHFPEASLMSECAATANTMIWAEIGELIAFQCASMCKERVLAEVQAIIQDAESIRARCIATYAE